MSVALSNCGRLGWTTDHDGYRYTPADPLSGGPGHAAGLRRPGTRGRRGGFAGFEPDACLLNRYEPGARMSLHQDRNERDFSAPIVSVSLGMPAVFLFGGLARSAPPPACRCSTATWWSGAARTACVSTACCR